MQSETIMFLIFTLISTITLVFIIIYFEKKKSKKEEIKKEIKNCKDNADELWDDSCIYFQENFPDPLLETPENIFPLLIKFSYSSKLKAPPIYLPMWYRIRYVNMKTGGYSKFGPWSKTPVLSGSCCLPCTDNERGGDCPFNSGYDSCNYNRPQIGVPESKIKYSSFLPDKDGKKIGINLHRYVGKSIDDLSPPDENAKDEIVGTMIIKIKVKNVQYLSWIDVQKNPCKNGCSIPSFCSSGKDDENCIGCLQK